MRKMKKMLIAIFSSLVIISCSTATSKTYYERGEYIKAIKHAVTEIDNTKKEADKLALENRINNIVTIYQQNLISAKGSYSKSEASFNMFRLLQAVETTPGLMNYTSILNEYDSAKMLNDAIEYAKDYARSINSIEPLEKLMSKMNREGIFNTRYVGTYQEFAKYVADKYYMLAYNAEVSGKMEEAAKNYRKTYESFKRFDSNYRNSYTKYIELNREIEIKKANELIEKANSNYALQHKEKAIEQYREAINLYYRQQMYEKVNTYKQVISRIEKEIKLEKANESFNKAMNNYNLGNYDKANDDFNKAYNIYKEYGQSEKMKQIKVYLQNLDFKSKEEQADRYFSQAINDYDRGNYSSAKSKLLNALEIYKVFNNNSKIRQINVYLDAIKAKTNSNFNPNMGFNQGNRLFAEGMDYLEKGSVESNYSKKIGYLNSALKAFEEIQRLNLLPEKSKQINDYISYIRRTLNNGNESNQYYYQKYLKLGIENKKKAESYSSKETSNYYYNLAVQNFEKALKYTNNELQIKESKKLYQPY